VLGLRARTALRFFGVSRNTREGVGLRLLMVVRLVAGAAAATKPLAGKDAWTMVRVTRLRLSASIVTQAGASAPYYRESLDRKEQRRHGMRRAVSLGSPVGHERTLLPQPGVRRAGLAACARRRRLVASGGLGCYALLAWCVLAAGDAQTPGVTAQGTVLDGISGVGIPFGHIRISRPTEGDTIAEASTDSEGKFALTGLASGTYVVSAEKTGYVSVMGGGASRITIEQGAHAGRVALSLTRAAAISGTVYDESGRLVRGATIAAVGLRNMAGVTRLVLAAAPVETDDRGSYRVYGLAPGCYSVVLLPGGEAPGGTAFAPVYFPGTVDPAEARPFELAAGESRSGTDLSEQQIGTGEVRGRVANIPPGWRLGQVAVTLLSAAGLQSQVATVQAGEGGDFDFTGVPAGSYQAVAWGPVLGMGAPLPSPAQQPLQGSRRVRVDAAQVQDLEIALRATVTIDGMARFAPDAEPAAGCFAAARVELHPVDPAPRSRSLSAGIAPSGHFVIRSIPAGSYTVRLLGLKGDCFLSGVRMGQAPAGTGPISIEADGAMTVLLGTRMGEVSGTVSDAANNPVQGAVVLALPARDESESEMAGVPRASSGDRGQFRLRVPPGHYDLLAAPEVLSTDFLDPGCRSRYSTVSVYVAPGEPVRAVMRLNQ